MRRFYQIARLAEGRTIFPGDVLRVDLDGVTPDALIENDVAFRAAAAPRAWFWLSGGGTYLLNGRYIPVARRSLEARVNPGKVSLFTGRADTAGERSEPWLLVRELFEELLLYDGETLLMPSLALAQPVIDAAYDAMRRAGVITPGPMRELPLTPVPLPTRPVRIREQGDERTHDLSWIAAADNDINVLYLFAADCDISRLRGRDGEFHADGDAVVHEERHIYLMDIADGSARPLSDSGATCFPSPDDMSPSLQFLLRALAGRAGP